MKSGRVKGGVAIPAVIGTGRQFRSNLAQPVFNASGKRVKGGSARKIIEITSDDLVQNGGQYKLMGGPAIPMQIVTDRAEKGGAAQVVYPVDILGNYDPTFAGYIYKMLNPDAASGYDPTGMIGFWPQNELSGGISIDHSGLGHHGAYTAVTLGQAGVPGMGMSSAGYDGATSFNNIYSAALAATFNGSEGTLVTWAQVPAAAWIDGVFRAIARLLQAGTDFVDLAKNTTNNSLLLRYTAGAVAESIAHVPFSPSTFFTVVLTWSKSAGVNGEFKAHVNKVQSGATQTALGVWGAGNLGATTTNIGATSTVPAGVFSGNIGPVLLYTEAKSLSAIEYISTP